MGVKKNNLFHLINAGDMSGAINSQNIDMSNFDNIGLTVEWSGNAHGNILFNCSDDGVNFTDLTFNPAYTQPNNNAQTMGISINQFPWKWLQVSYTPVSGSGTLDVWIFQKDLN